MKQVITFVRKFWWIVFPLLVVVFFIINSRPKDKIVFSPQYKELTEAVYASGNILPDNEYKIFPSAEGYIKKKLVTEGDEIQANQPLFLIENAQQNIRLQNANETLIMAEINFGENSPVLGELKTSIEIAKNQLRNDSTMYVRYKNLWSQQATSQNEHDRAKLVYENSRNNYLLQRSRYEKTRNDLLLGLQNARSQYRLNSEQNQDYIVRSNSSGIIFEIYKEEGEAVRRNEALALVGKRNEVYINLSIDEKDIDKIKTGQEVLVKIDVYPDKIFKAAVTKVYKMLDRQNQSFRVDARFAEKYPTDFSGLTAEANILISHKTKALAVPKSIIFGGDSLLVKRDGKPVKIKIKKGIENYDWVEVLEGINENEEILQK